MFLPFTAAILTLNKKLSTGRMAVKHSRGKGLARKGCWLELVAGAGGLKKKKKIRDFAVDSVFWG